MLSSNIDRRSAAEEERLRRVNLCANLIDELVSEELGDLFPLSQDEIDQLSHSIA